MKISILMLLTLVSWQVSAQFVVSGTVYDTQGLPLSGSTLVLSNQAFMADAQGKFRSAPLASGTYNLQVSFVGFQTLDTVINVQSNKNIHLHLLEDSTMLDQLIVKTSQQQKIVNSEKVQQQELMRNYSGSLAKTLERVPGVNAMEIGAGASKPIIRGLGFNRVAVSENGVKQEGQQWGADHGLEIDALNTEEVEVIKGVGAIEYGSDAIGGVIRINNEKIPEIHSFSGTATAFGKSVNDAFGFAAAIKSRGDHFFYKLKASGQEYGDYRVPTDNIYYLNTNIPIVNQRMKNTAGKELDFYGQVGYVGRNIQQIFSVSSVYSKSGFFPGSHGIPSVASVQDDGDSRNIDLPNQSVHHYKVSSSTALDLSEGNLLKIGLAFQSNIRQESSFFHSHYGNLEAPEKNPNLELEFVLNTFDFSLKYEHLSKNNHKTTLGFQQNFQNNTIGGYGFLLPKFNKNTMGFFGIHEHQFSERLKVEAGARFDYAEIQVRPYYDNLLYDFLIDKGLGEVLSDSYAQRSQDLDRSFSSFNASLGGVYELSEQWNLGMTLGTNFRFPTAIELAANGLHHGAFRHEKGNPNLDPERGWALDFHLDYRLGAFETKFSPYLYYFNNYIFLKPSGIFSVLPDGGQIYEYTQSKALISGFEWQMAHTFWDRLKAEAVFEFVYNKQITDFSKTDYPLPFSTPANLFFELNYQFNDWKFLKDNHVYINGKWHAKQERIAQNESITPSYQLFGAGLSTSLKLDKFEAKIILSGSNLLNTKALNHTSYYRALEIPELGRSLQLMVQIPF